MCLVSSLQARLVTHEFPVTELDGTCYVRVVSCAHWWRSYGASRVVISWAVGLIMSRCLQHARICFDEAVSYVRGEEG